MNNNHQFKPTLLNIIWGNDKYRKYAIVIITILIFPIGAWLMWKYKLFNLWQRVGLCIIGVIFINIFTGNLNRVEVNDNKLQSDNSNRSNTTKDYNNDNPGLYESSNDGRYKNSDTQELIKYIESTFVKAKNAILIIKDINNGMNSGDLNNILQDADRICNQINDAASPIFKSNNFNKHNKSIISIKPRLVADIRLRIDAIKDLVNGNSLGYNNKLQELKKKIYLEKAQLTMATIIIATEINKQDAETISNMITLK